MPDILIPDTLLAYLLHSLPQQLRKKKPNNFPTTDTSFNSQEHQKPHVNQFIFSLECKKIVLISCSIG